MKITQQEVEKKFVPIIITLESQEEVDKLVKHFANTKGDEGITYEDFWQLKKLSLL